MLAHPTFAYSLRPFQQKALAALADPAHVICIAATGSGKSLIYETLARKHRTLLITPLVALARQQKQKLASIGVPVALAAGPDPEAPPETKSGVWILSPERLAHPATLDKIRRWDPTLVTVDECHCLWDWGENFRPSFQKIPEVLRQLKISRSLWLSATLPWPARLDLKKELPGPWIEIGEFALPATLHVDVRRVPLFERNSVILDFAYRRQDPGIIFVHTRAAAHRLSLLLSESGKRCAIYHAGMATEERRLTERKIENRDPEIIVATSAFGMGMDHPHLRWALLSQAPTSLLSLAQSLGRAGRHPEYPSRGIVLWDLEDFQLLKWMMKGSPRRLAELVDVRDFLLRETCRRASLSRYFAPHYDNAVQWRPASVSCNLCDRCNTD